MTDKGKPGPQAASKREHPSKKGGKVSDNQPMELHEELIEPAERWRTPDRRVPPKRKR